MTTKLKNTANKLRELLRKNKITLSIQHSRMLIGGAAIDENECFDYCLTKKEYYDALKRRQFITLPDHNFLNEEDADIANICYGDFVNPCGGFTRVTLTFEDGTVIPGKKNFKENEPFVKQLGVVHAIKDALRHVKF